MFGFVLDMFSICSNAYYQEAEATADDGDMPPLEGDAEDASRMEEVD